ncbi:MAG: hypothetical protein AB8B91_22295, partial [Rubripirellula sp.]
MLLLPGKDVVQQLLQRMRKIRVLLLTQFISILYYQTLIVLSAPTLPLFTILTHTQRPDRLT